MNTNGSESASPGPRNLLERPATCALYLTDALDSKPAAAIAEVLRDICLARGSSRNSLEPDANLRVSDLLEAVRSSGLRLVALPIR